MENTLQDRALLAATDNILSLKGLFAFCANNPRTVDSCDRSAFFWRESLMRIFGKTMVLQRGDLTDNDWPIFAKILATGLGFEYAVRWNEADGDYGPPEPYYNIVGDDVYHRVFKIPVAVPVVGTRGYFVRWKFDGTQVHETSSFFVGPDDVQTLRLSSEWVALEYRRYHIEQLTHALLQPGMVDFFTEDNYHGDQGDRRPIPDSTILTQLVINNDASDTGVKHDYWVAYYGDYNEICPSNYSDSSYIIAPITF